jgi:hypothetical protein
MKYSIQAVSAEGSHVELHQCDQVPMDAAAMLSSLCPLASIHVYVRELFQMPGGEVGDERFRLSLVAKFRDGEEVKEHRGMTLEEVRNVKKACQEMLAKSQCVMKEER